MAESRTGAQLLWRPDDGEKIVAMTHFCDMLIVATERRLIRLKKEGDADISVLDETRELIRCVNKEGGCIKSAECRRRGECLHGEMDF